MKTDAGRFEVIVVGSGGMRQCGCLAPGAARTSRARAGTVRSSS